MSKKVVICGIDTSTLPKLNGQQSRELLEKIKQGDDEARRFFIFANFRLVLSVVLRYNKRVENLDDLFQIGCVGLIKSVDNFDTTLNVRFSTYAVPMIVGEIRRFLRESNSLRVSRGIRDIAYQALQTRERLETESNCEVTVDRIASEMDLPVFKVVYCLDAISDPVSLSESVYSTEEDNLTLMEQLSDNFDGETIWAENVTLKDAMRQLEQRERNILIKRYFEGKTQTEVSTEVGISQAQVSRIEKNAVGKLRNEMS
ncbi:MAG: sigma-70 family RNA polymerase sigma factor [Corallococcus sp.]|nr:sigma-70 family RNA polymerase sigma factor [Corallococcus sp.]